MQSRPAKTPVWRVAGEDKSEGDLVAEGCRQRQQKNPVQLVGRALTDIRRVQKLLEMNYPNQTNAIQIQREAGT